MKRFDSEVSEVLMYPLGMAFNVSDDHANHPCRGHVFRGAELKARGQNMSREQQRSNYAHAKTLREQIPDLPLAGKLLAARQDGVRGGRILLCIHGFGQESNG